MRGRAHAVGAGRDAGRSRPNLSQQLATLQRAGLVKRRREGVHVLYEIVDPRLKEACGVIEEIVSRELSSRIHALDSEAPHVPTE